MSAVCALRYGCALRWWPVLRFSAQMYRKIAKQTGLKVGDIEISVRQFLYSIMTTVAQGEDVVIPGFGSFRLGLVRGKYRSAKEGKEVEGVKHFVFFRKGSKFKEAILMNMPALTVRAEEEMGIRPAWTSSRSTKKKTRQPSKKPPPKAAPNAGRKSKGTGT